MRPFIEDGPEMSEAEWEAMRARSRAAAEKQRLEKMVRAVVSGSELEAMVRAVVSGSGACHAYLVSQIGAAAIVDAAQALLAEIDRRCGEGEREQR